MTVVAIKMPSLGFLQLDSMHTHNSESAVWRCGRQETGGGPNGPTLMNGGRQEAGGGPYFWVHVGSGLVSLVGSTVPLRAKKSLSSLWNTVFDDDAHTYKAPAFGA